MTWVQSYVKDNPEYYAVRFLYFLDIALIWKRHNMALYVDKELYENKTYDIII
jgi:hypothetical protein